LHRKIGSKGRNRLANSELNRGEYRGNVAMRLHAYRDENRSRHFDLISGGQHPRSIDLVVILTSSILVIAAACALIAPIALTTVGLARWIHQKRPLESEEKRTAKHKRAPGKNSRCLTGQNRKDTHRNDGRLKDNRADGDDPDFPFGLGVHGLTEA
jgi:hypothetical protein